MRKLILALVALVAFVGCNYTNSRSNLPGDNKNAVGCCSKFEDLRKAGKTDEAIKMMTEEVDKEEVMGVFTKVDSLLGKLVSFEPGDVSSKVETNNGMESGNFSVILHCVYERGKATEEFGLHSGSSHLIQITGFHVNIDL